MSKDNIQYARIPMITKVQGPRIGSYTIMDEKASDAVAFMEENYGHTGKGNRRFFSYTRLDNGSLVMKLTDEGELKFLELGCIDQRINELGENVFVSLSEDTPQVRDLTKDPRSGIVQLIGGSKLTSEYVAESLYGSTPHFDPDHPTSSTTFNPVIRYSRSGLPMSTDHFMRNSLHSSRADDDFREFKSQSNELDGLD
jgi:hypothetical protein